MLILAALTGGLGWIGLLSRVEFCWTRLDGLLSRVDQRATFMLYRYQPRYQTKEG